MHVCDPNTTVHVRNTSDQFACLKLGKAYFLKLPLLACLLALCKMVLHFEPIYLLACLENGLIIQNHLLTCLFA